MELLSIFLIIIVVILLGLIIYIYVKKPNCPECKKCEECEKCKKCQPPAPCPACPACPQAVCTPTVCECETKICPEQKNCPEPTICPTIPEAAPCPSCDVCKNNFGIKFNPKTDDIKIIFDKAQNILDVGQDFLCISAKNMYAASRTQFETSLRTQVEKAPADQTNCDVLKSVFTKSVEEAYVQFVREIGSKKLITIDTPSSPINKKVNIQADITINNATVIKNLVIELGKHVITMMCTSGKVNADRIMKGLDDMFYSICP